MNEPLERRPQRCARLLMGVWARQWRAVRRDYAAAGRAAWCLEQAIVWREKSKQWKEQLPKDELPTASRQHVAQSPADCKSAAL